MDRLPFARPLDAADCPTCNARPLAGSPVAEVFDRLARDLRDAEGARASFLARLDLGDVRAILDAVRCGIRPVRP